MVLLDGDDSLVGAQVLALLNAVYQKKNPALVYSTYLTVQLSDRITPGSVSRPIPKQNLYKGTFRKLKKFYTSHLKTMYVDLFRKIEKKDLQDN